MSRLTPEEIEQNRGRSYRRSDIIRMLKQYGFVSDNENAPHSQWKHRYYSIPSLTIAGHKGKMMDMGIVWDAVERCRQVEELRKDQVEKRNREIEEKEAKEAVEESTPDIAPEEKFQIPEGYSLKVDGDRMVLYDAEYPELGVTLSSKCSTHELQNSAEALSQVRATHLETLKRLEEECGFIIIPGHGQKTKLENPDYGLKPIELPLYERRNSYQQSVTPALDEAELTVMDIQERTLKLVDKWKKLGIELQPEPASSEDDAPAFALMEKAYKEFPSVKASLASMKRKLAEGERTAQLVEQRQDALWPVERIGTIPVDPDAPERPLLSKQSLDAFEKQAQETEANLNELFDTMLQAWGYTRREENGKVLYRSHIYDLEPEYELTASPADEIIKKAAICSYIDRINVYLALQEDCLNEMGCDLKNAKRSGSLLSFPYTQYGGPPVTLNFMQQGVSLSKLGENLIHAYDKLMTKILGFHCGKDFAEFMSRNPNGTANVIHNDSGTEISFPYCHLETMQAPKALRTMRELYAQGQRKTACEPMEQAIADAIAKWGAIIIEPTPKKPERYIHFRALDKKRQIPTSSHEAGIKAFLRDVGGIVSELENRKQQQEEALAQLAENNFIVDSQQCAINGHAGHITIVNPDGGIVLDAGLFGSEQVLARDDFKSLQKMLSNGEKVRSGRASESRSAGAARH